MLSGQKCFDNFDCGAVVAFCNLSYTENITGVCNCFGTNCSSFFPPGADGADTGPNAPPPTPNGAPGCSVELLSIVILAVVNVLFATDVEHGCSLF
jgi:hypothetical protein